MRKPTILGRAALLRQHGYGVVVTTSGRERFNLLQHVAVDAVVLDYRMPEMMSDAVAARMKRCQVYLRFRRLRSLWPKEQ